MKSYQKSRQVYTGGSSTLIEREKQQLEKIKLRQVFFIFYYFVYLFFEQKAKRIRTNDGL